MTDPNKLLMPNAGPDHRLRDIRWTLLETSERLRSESQLISKYPLAARVIIIPAFWFLRGGLALVTNLLSLPIYVTRNTPAHFATYARRRGETYVDSYVLFNKSARWTISLIVVTIIVGGLAVASATFLRSKITPASETNRVFRVGILKRAATLDPLIAGFKRGLAARGYPEGERVIYDEPANSGSEDALEAIVNGFADQKKDLILAVGDVAALAVKKGSVTINIPTVFYANFDPVADGLINAYSSSANNFIGVGNGALVKQQVELLERIAPTMRTLGVMSVPGDGTNQDFIRALTTASVGKNFTLRAETITVVEDIPAAIDALAAAGATAIYLAPSSLTAPRLGFVAQAVLDRKLILVGNSAKNAEAGALFALMADLDSVGRQLAAQADQILRGAQASLISSQFPAESLLALNLKTAAALGLTIPADIIERADVLY